MKHPKCSYCGSPPGESNTCQNCGSANPDLEKIQNLAAICFQQAINNSKNQEIIQKCLEAVKTAAKNGEMEAVADTGCSEISNRRRRAIINHLEELGLEAEIFWQGSGVFSTKGTLMCSLCF